MKNLVLDKKITLEEFMSVVKCGVKIEFSKEYKNRVEVNRKLVEKWVEEKRIIYGVTTGFGTNSTCIISKEDAEKLQKNIVLSHSTSVGRPMTFEETRSTMLAVLMNLGQGYSGIRLETLERYRTFLNQGFYPFAPKEGSVGYLCPEVHIAMAIIGEGKIITEEGNVDADIF